MQHLLEPRYREVWNATRSRVCLSAEAVAASRFYFHFPDVGSAVAVPKRFDTYAMICGLPFEARLQAALESCWQECLSSLGHPLAYGVEPANRHTEIFLFQGPHESFGNEQVHAAIADSLRIARQMPPVRIQLRHPFITPDGTIVAPGYDTPAGVVDLLRAKLRENLQAYSRKQSQWVHVSLGRILEPIAQERWQATLQWMDSHWGEVIGETLIEEWLCVWERQWYMVDREVLHRVRVGVGR